MSDTPRTDASCGWPVGQHGRINSRDLIMGAEGPFVHSAFARELERENAALREALGKWRRLCEMGLQDVVPDWVGVTIEPLWELTDGLVPSEKRTEAKP